MSDDHTPETSGGFESPSDPLAEIELHGRSLRDWHNELTHSPEGEPQGHLLCPTSRYGRTADENAYWAIASELIHIEDDEENNVLTGLTWFMSLCVNDSEEVLALVRDNWWSIPEALREHLDYEDAGLNMPQQAALADLCGRYGVSYEASDYGEQFDLPAGYRAGWVGGLQHRVGTENPTIYVGVSDAGEVSS